MSVQPTLKKWTKSLEIYDKTARTTKVLHYSICNLTSLIMLKLRVDIVYLPDNAFPDLRSLTYLDISSSGISKLHEMSFSNLTNLHVLLLAENRITYFPGALFHNLKLNILDISSNPHLTLDISESLIPADMPLETLRVQYSLMCCLRPDVECVAVIREYSRFHCTPIIPVPWLQGSAWVLMVAASIFCILNLAMWIKDGCKSKKWKAKHALAFGLALSNFLLILYLTLLISSHTAFDNVTYVAISWRSSHMCRALQMLSILSIELSTITNFFILLDRFICIVVRPFAQMGLSIKQAVISVICSWLAAFSIIFSFFMTFPNYVQSSVCIIIGLYMSIHFSIPYVSVNTLVVITGICFYIATMAVALKSHFKFHKKPPTALLLKSSIIISSHLFFWFASNLLSILALAGERETADIEVYFGILVLPVIVLINSAVYRP